MKLHLYDSDLGGIRPRSIFLAGPTTDAKPDGCAEVAGMTLSSWRAEAIRLLAAVSFSGDVVVPEFAEKGNFHTTAKARFGDPPSRAVVDWEERAMAAVGCVVAWADVRREQPGLGLNARPEIQGLIVRWHARQAQVPGLWAPRRLVLGIPEQAQAVTRFYASAEAAGLPVHATLSETIWAALMTPLRSVADMRRDEMNQDIATAIDAIAGRESEAGS